MSSETPTPSRPATPVTPVPELNQGPPVPPYAAHNALLATLEDPATTKRASYILPALRLDTTLPAFLTQELSVDRINKIHSYLWFAGPRGQERSLHRQIMAAREIVIAEKIDLHLCWEGRQLYLKPIPEFLLHYDFFEEHLCTSPSEDGRLDLYASACGFLRSYTRLIQHESDLYIAREMRLVPSSVTWEKWSAFAADIIKNTSGMIMCQRYDYGELRLTRLNLLYEVHTLEPFHWGDNRYKFLFDTISFEWLVLAFAYFSVVLTAMQVVLATGYGMASGSVQRAAFGFGAFVLAMAGVSWIIIGGFVGMRVYMFFFSETWIGRQQYRIYYLDRFLEALVSE